jgi:hypothetical protein
MAIDINYNVPCFKTPLKYSYVLATDLNCSVPCFKSLLKYSHMYIHFFLYLQLFHASMSQFTFANELKNCVRMDEPITKGPIPRWQRKCIEASNLRCVFCNIKSNWIERG